MPNVEYVEIEREYEELPGEDGQQTVIEFELPVEDSWFGSTRTVHRRLLLLLLFCCAAAVFAVQLNNWRQHLQYYRRPTFRLALQRSVFLNALWLGSVSDVKIGHFHPGMGEEIAVVCSNAVCFTDLAGHWHSRVDFAMPGEGTQLLDTHGHYCFLQPGVSNRLSVMDARGNPCWSVGGDGRAGKYAAGDLAGNGQCEYVTGWLAPHGGYLRLLGAHGQLLWERPDPEAYFRDFAVVDARHDGRQIMYPDGDHLVLLDGRGQPGRESALAFYAGLPRALPVADAHQRPVLLTVHHTLLWCFGFDGRLLARRYLPGEYYDCCSYSATPVILRAGEPPYFAVALNNGEGRLLLYDPHGASCMKRNTRRNAAPCSPSRPERIRTPRTCSYCGEGTTWRLSAGQVTPVK